MVRRIRKYRGGRTAPSLPPAIMAPPEFGTNYRESAVLKQQYEAERHNAMINPQNGGNEETVITIPTINTGVKTTPMAHSALVGSSNTTLQIQENNKFDAFDPNKPVPFKGGWRFIRRKRIRTSKKRRHSKNRTRNKRKRQQKTSNNTQSGGKKYNKSKKCNRKTSNKRK
jgi:hypothetical protein